MDTDIASATHLIGTSKQRFELSSQNEHEHHIVALIAQSRSIIQVYSCDLPNVIFASQAISTALSGFVRSNRHAHLEVLLKDTRLLTQRRLPLLGLNMRLSAIKIKKAHEDYCFGEKTLLLFDKTAIIEKPETSSSISKVCYSDKAHAKSHSQVFSENWGRASDDPNLREQLI